MAYTFKTGNGNKTFMQFNEPNDAGLYILNKKAQTIYCTANICQSNFRVNTQSDLLLRKRSNYINYYSCSDFDKTALNINLITQLNLSGDFNYENPGTPIVVIDTSSNISPAPIYNPQTNPPYLNYIIDPCGNLFGNGPCGVNSYVKNMQYLPQYTNKLPYNPPNSINN